MADVAVAGGGLVDTCRTGPLTTCGLVRRDGAENPHERRFLWPCAERRQGRAAKWEGREKEEART
jgi:hypothetical protein